MNIVLFGPQGSGKGTQAELLASKYNLPILATGDIFRREIKNETELGRKVTSLIKEGNLVPDEITNEIVLSELQKEKYKNGFILDGFPRNMIQLKELEKENALTHVFELEINDEEVIKRMGTRRICEKCGAIYSLGVKPPKQESVCDSCGGALILRGDDKPEAIQKRLDIYHKETEPVLNFYREKGRAIKINGARPIEKVFEDIVKAIDN
jgi:adenylate kinase